jgi:hypothetical protein
MNIPRPTEGSQELREGGRINADVFCTSPKGTTKSEMLEVGAGSGQQGGGIGGGLESELFRSKGGRALFARPNKAVGEQASVRTAYMPDGGTKLTNVTRSSGDNNPADPEASPAPEDTVLKAEKGTKELDLGSPKDITNNSTVVIEQVRNFLCTPPPPLAAVANIYRIPLSSNISNHRNTRGKTLIVLLTSPRQLSVP